VGHVFNVPDFPEVEHDEIVLHEFFNELPGSQHRIPGREAAAFRPAVFPEAVSFGGLPALVILRTLPAGNVSGLALTRC